MRFSPCKRCMIVNWDQLIFQGCIYLQWLTWFYLCLILVPLLQNRASWHWSYALITPEFSMFFQTLLCWFYVSTWFQAEDGKDLNLCFKESFCNFFQPVSIIILKQVLVPNLSSFLCSLFFWNHLCLLSLLKTAFSKLGTPCYMQTLFENKWYFKAHNRLSVYCNSHATLI